VIWKNRRDRRAARKATRKAAVDVKRRSLSQEKLEQRQLLAADPIHVGVVYLETDYLESDNDVGSDSRGDRFQLTFNGGAADTTLNELRIRTDKDGDGISVGDPIFDTEVGGRGKKGAHDFQIVRIDTLDGRQATAQAMVADGGQELIIKFDNFRAGDRLEFTLDVDEVLRNSLDLEIFNDRLDVITSGQEFQDSILEAVFEAPHYETATADAIFLNEYGSPRSDHGLALPDDDGNDPDSRPNRSAAAVASTQQTPKPVALSGHVWLDNNLDLVRQANEAVLAGVELSLFVSDGAEGYFDTGHRVETDSSGFYGFSDSLGLMPGDYRIVQTQPAGLFSVGSVPGTVAGASTGIGSTVDIISSISIPLGDTEAINMDFAEAAPASIGGSVYRDDNQNGVRDAGETGIEGVTVRLVPVETVATQAQLIASTDGDGNYQFDGLVPGQYEIIEVTQPAGFVDGTDVAGTIDGVTVGRAENPGDAIRQISLGGDDHGVDYDFGELAYGELSGFVYLIAPGQDCTSDHDAIGNEPLGGVIVELQTPDGNVISRVSTTPMGRYQFEAVPPGEYRIVEYTPDGMLDGSSYAGTIDGVRSGDPVNGGIIERIFLTPGGNGVEYNFCEVAPVSISGTVYHDQDDDGVQDAIESGIAQVVVELVDEFGNSVATTLTDSAGRYEFTELPPGTYQLIQHQPAGYLDGKDSLGQVDGQPVGQAGNDSFQQIELPQGLSGVDYNFGELLPASLSGNVHLDTDGDCYRDPDEPPLSDVVLRLLDANGDEVQRTTTRSDGTYHFTDLQPGRYTVVQEQPPGLFDGSAKPGSEGGDVGINRISAIDLTSGVDAVDYDFCEIPPSSLSGLVFNDRDQDCVQDTGESGIEGVTIELRDATGDVIATTTTDADGAYRFDGLRAGTYTVFEVQPNGFLQGGQMLGSAGGTVVGIDLMRVTLEPGQDAVDYLFCEYEPASISGSVWADPNEDRRREAGEQPIAGVPLFLIDETGAVVRTTVTDANGNYTFDQLPPGVYSVAEQQPDGYFHGGQVAGNQGGLALFDDFIMDIMLPSGVDAVNYDFPELPPATISGFVFVDGGPIETEDEIAAADLRDYKDGARTADDTPLGNVKIEIRDQFGQPLAPDAFLPGTPTDGSVVMTDSDGYYVFEGLRPGLYTLFQSHPEGYVDSLDTPGTGGGFAINAADSLTAMQQVAVASLGNAHSYDALLNLFAASGENSTENNFSEIVLRILEPPAPEEPDDPQEPVAFLNPPEPDLAATFAPAPDEFERKQVPFSMSPAEVRVKPPLIADVDFVTWHLSVINGGYPRGAVTEENVFRQVATKQIRDQQDSVETDQGSWKLFTLEGEVIETSKEMTLGAKDAVALVGDFNGDGKDETAIYVGGRWFIDLNGNGVWDEGDLWVQLGTEMDQPVVGDWDGDGKADVGIFGRHWERDAQRIRLDAGLPDPANRTRQFIESQKQRGLISMRLRGQDRPRLLRRGSEGELRADAVDHVFQFGEDVDTPVSGDWNGDGIDQIGTFRGGQWVLDVEGDGREKLGEVNFRFGQPGDEPVVGDFNGDGIDEVAVLRGNVWIIDSDGDRRLTAADRQIEVPAQDSDSQPVVGDWDGDGRDEIGFYRKAE
jgi:protocatechuate 3,4-dioxygenase beta subunit